MKLIIEGKEYELKWGIGAHTLLCEMEGWTLSQLETTIFSGGDGSTTGMLKLTYCALKNNALIKGLEFDISLFQFYDWFDNEPDDIAGKIIEDYKQSKFMGKTIGEMYNIVPANTADTDKKKVKKTSRTSTKK